MPLTMLQQGQGDHAVVLMFLRAIVLPRLAQTAFV